MSASPVPSAPTLALPRKGRVSKHSPVGENPMVGGLG